jgi:DNA-binding CsgD family transcriptional regulator
MSHPADRGNSAADGVPAASERPIRLTARQSEVLALIADGLTDAEAADRLGISPRTVRMHADVLRAKLGVKRRRQLPMAYRRMRSLGYIAEP